MTTTQIKLLTHADIANKIKRMAYEIYENNISENELLLVGLDERGYKLAQILSNELSNFSEWKCSLHHLKMDRTNLLNEGKLQDEKLDLTNKTIVLIDDVLDSGKTLFYALKYFMNFNVAKITTVVLVDRSHRKFPVHADIVGLSLSTTMQDHISVTFETGNFSAVLK